MMNFRNSLKKFSLLSLLLLAGTTLAKAGSTVSLTDGSTLVAGGDAKELEISLTSTSTDVWMVTGTVTLPEGFSFQTVGKNSNGVDMFAATTSRTDGFLVSLTKSSGYWQVANVSKTAISGTDGGAISTIKVAVDASVAPGEYTIGLSNFEVYHADNSKEQAQAAAVTVTVTDAQTAPVTSGPIAFSPAALSLAAGESTTVDVVMNYDVDLVDFEANISASEGLTIGVTGADSYNAKRGKIGIDEIAANAGKIFSVSIEAAADFSGEGTITLKNIEVYDADNNEVDFDDITLTIFKAAEPEGENLSFDFSETSIAMAPRDRKTVTVTMTNDFTVGVFMASLVLPEGVTAEVSKSDRMTGALNYANGQLMSFGDITRGEGAVFTLTLIAGDSFAGEGVVTLKNLAVSTKQSKEIYADNISLNLQAATLSFAFSEDEVALAAGESKAVEVSMNNNFTVGVFMATLDLPEGMTATVAKSDRMTGALNYANGQLMSFGNIAEADGTIFTLTLTADETFAGEGVVTLKNLGVSTLSSNDVEAADITLTVKAQSPYTYYEGWNTVCLPFEAAVADFGEGAKAYEFTDFADGELTFSIVTTLEAGKPYVVYAPGAVELQAGEKTAEAQTVTHSGASFMGTFVAVADMADKYGVTDKGRIQKGGEGSSLKAYHAYFEIPQTAQAARLVFRDTVTGIEKVADVEKDENMYNLSGQRVMNTRQGGVYIKAGKKVMVK
jgi:hypothetical protein